MVCLVSNKDPLKNMQKIWDRSDRKVVETQAEGSKGK